MLRLLVDVDGVVANSGLEIIRAVNSLFDRDHMESDITRWSYQECLCLTPEEERAAERQMALEDLPEYPGAVEAIRELMREHEVVFVTSPHTRILDWGYWRNRWLEARFPGCKIVTTRHKELVPGDVLIDDKPENHYAWLYANRKGTSVLWAHPYNEGRVIDVRMCRMNSWPMLQGLIKGLEKR